MALLDGIKKWSHSIMNNGKGNDTLWNPKEILAPVTGAVKPLSETADEVFATGMMGPGILLIPSEGKLYAPCDGTVTSFFPTGHAICLQSASGTEILIHVGINTVEMKGKGFSSKVKEGSQVKAGDLLLEMDLEQIKEAGYPLDTPVIILNSDDYEEITPTDVSSVTHGQLLISLE